MIQEQDDKQDIEAVERFVSIVKTKNSAKRLLKHI
jgi:hypothetical protein